MVGLDLHRSRPRTCMRCDGECYLSGRERDGPCGLNWGGRLHALLASGVLLQIHRYGGPLAERASDASTRSVAGGITTVRSCIA
jgi:hypothetical protein